MRPIHSALPRRVLLAAPALLTLPALAQVPRTPAQMEGPYYPRTSPVDADADLLQVAGQPRPARGQPLLLEGVVRGPDGAALPGARIEIWQADHAGIYLHPAESRLADRDTAFQGFGGAIADGAGRYAFRTIRPGLYPGRTRHIHVRAASADGRLNLTSQIYFPNEPGNESDPLYRRMNAEARALLTARISPWDGGERASFDIFLA